MLLFVIKLKQRGNHN